MFVANHLGDFFNEAAPLKRSVQSQTPHRRVRIRSYVNDNALGVNQNGTVNNTRDAVAPAARGLLRRVVPRDNHPENDLGS